MSDATTPDGVRALMEEQLRHSRRLRDRIEELENERHAPIAVVGMGLRLPPAIRTPEEFWEFLLGTDSALGEIPADRPGLRAAYDPEPGRLGRSYVRHAGFLDEIADFDADFFGISQREARLLDPQQRMLLETSWEALERAGIAVRRADRLNVGIYLGIMTSEYSERNEDRADLSKVDPYYITGGGLSFGAGRISHLLGFSGPVMGVETACSSSMTTLHLAVQGLRNRECRYALAGGANLLLSAALMVALCQTRALSPDGRSKSFLASADGYGRGEGIGVVALMRLDDAEREGRPVLAVIRGSAVNHDGAASGLTAPNGPAQQEVIRAALADARVEPAEVGFIEAHGTGTALGDPIEIGALAEVLGKAVQGRGTSLSIGSVKSRLGHLEGASGIASVIKTVLMLRHGVIPAAADEWDGDLNPHIPWDRLPFTVPRQNRPWPARLPRRVAGINSFGMSGVNVHAVLEAYQDEPTGRGESGPELLTLSARSPEALDRLAVRMIDYLERADTPLADVCHTTRAGRAAFAHRITVQGCTAPDMVRELQEARLSGGPAAGSTPPRTVTLDVDDSDERLDAGLRTLGIAFPALAGGPVAVDGAAGRLKSVLQGFGLRVQARRRPRRDGETAAQLVWESSGRSHVAPLVGDRPEATPALLQAALGSLFAAGADLRLDALRGPATRFAGDLPTYPFQGRRYWIDEPAGSGPAAAEPGGSGRARQVAAPAALDQPSMTAYLFAELREVLQADDLDPETSFLDNGGDSFLSTMFITGVKERFEVSMTADQLSLEVPLRELLGKLAANIVVTAETSRPGWRG